MKKKNNKLISIVKQFSCIIILFLSIVLISCNSSSKQKVNKEELAKEVQDVKEEVNEILTLEKEELKTEVDSILNEVNRKIYSIQNDLQKGTKKINAETESLIAELQGQSDSLSQRVDEIREQGDQNWEEFKEELHHDTKNLAESVENFFTDNK